MSKFNVAIDGPAGAGKSTIAKIIAKELGYIYIDTGAMYRAMALKAIQKEVSLVDGEVITRLVEQTDISLAYDCDGNQQVFLDGQDVSVDIRSPKVTQSVSQIAALQVVREALVYMQKRMGAEGGVVMDGRDIGTWVLPDAKYKFYLTASVEERAQRRFQEMKEKGYTVTLETLAREIAERDERDRQRDFAPLVQAPDAILVDSTLMTIQEVINYMLNVIRGGSGCSI